MIGEFNKLKQMGSVDEYIQKFEELKSYMTQRNRHLDEDYFVKSFISGLKEDVRVMVEMLLPNTLNQAIFMARKQEVQLESLSRHYKGTVRSNPMTFKQKGGHPHNNNSNKSNQRPERYPPIKRLSR